MNFLPKREGVFSDDSHMAVIIERLHSNASLDKNSTKSFVTVANSDSLSAIGVQAGWVCGQKAPPQQAVSSGRQKTDGGAGHGVD